MLKIILSRLAQGFLVLIFLYTATFFLVRWMPEDMFTSDKALSAQALKEKQAEFYLDRPYWEQYKISVGKLFEGDLYKSGVKEQEVTKIISQSFPVSFILGTAGMLIAICIGIPAGIIAALRKNSYIDYGTMLLALIGISVPSFVLGPLLAKGLGETIPFLKVAGWGGSLDWFLPSITLGLATAAYLARITRAGMLDIFSQDYIRTAKAKGVSEKGIIIKHALKGGLIPSIAYIGPAFAMLITGSFSNALVWDSISLMPLKSATSSFSKGSCYSLEALSY